MATIDYMIAAYGPYSASATGGNGFARDFLAGIAAMYSVPSEPAPKIVFQNRSEADLHSVQQHGQYQYARVAFDVFGIYGYSLHDPHLHLLLEGTNYS